MSVQTVAVAVGGIVEVRVDVGATVLVLVLVRVLVATLVEVAPGVGQPPPTWVSPLARIIQLPGRPRLSIVPRMSLFPRSL
jgi:hypothetical protein